MNKREIVLIISVMLIIVTGISFENYINFKKTEAKDVKAIIKEQARQDSIFRKEIRSYILNKR